jgi:hypothetical protein
MIVALLVINSNGYLSLKINLLVTGNARSENAGESLFLEFKEGSCNYSVKDG